jgi:hypothetical protein
LLLSPSLVPEEFFFEAFFDGLSSKSFHEFIQHLVTEEFEVALANHANLLGRQRRIRRRRPPVGTAIGFAASGSARQLSAIRACAFARSGMSLDIRTGLHREALYGLSSCHRTECR